MSEKTIVYAKPKGNLIRFYLGENGKQWGDDWDDTPYESNAGAIYDDDFNPYKTTLGAVPFQYEVADYAHYFNMRNSDRSMKDFMDRKAPFLYIMDAETFEVVDTIYFGDTLADHPIMYDLSDIRTFDLPKPEKTTTQATNEDEKYDEEVVFAESDSLW